MKRWNIWEEIHRERSGGKMSDICFCVVRLREIRILMSVVCFIPLPVRKHQTKTAAALRKI